VKQVEVFVGIDIGGTKIAGGVVTAKGEMVSSKQRKTPIQDGGEKILEESIALGRALIEDTKEDTVAGIGIGAGGQIDSTKGIVFSATDVIPGWTGLEIAPSFKRSLGLPAFVDNDVNALAMGEYRFGAAKGLATVLFLALGTGVGGALLLHGKIHSGAHWSGGEFGHILLTMDMQSRWDLGGHSGTLESYVSGSGLVETWKELTGDRHTKLQGSEIAELAVGKQDKAALRAIEMTGKYLGFGLVSLANALDPDMIVIGGGLASLGELLLCPARKILTDHALPGPSTCKVQTASLGVNAHVIGAATLAMAAREQN
jgi:glucokinase